VSILVSNTVKIAYRFEFGKPPSERAALRSQNAQFSGKRRSAWRQCRRRSGVRRGDNTMTYAEYPGVIYMCDF